MPLPLVGQAAIAGVSALISGIGGQAEADAANRQAEAAYKQNLLNWKYGKKTTKLDYRHERKQ